eukprot:TRINITY_DN2198_c0_g1_i2.p2 TRINITY_DN2198_c0_g1~~TRINITY_DN2198_c0_g1_i2.p2  ORF type:complete len:333 (+),score=-18.11 TRINITY_DN2198_c0_g1_i2:87-1001(+)
MENYTILPELPQPHTTVTELRINYFRYPSKPLPEFWYSMYILLVPIRLADRISQCDWYSYLFLCIQHLPFTSALAYYLLILYSSCGSEKIYRELVAIAICSILCVLAIFLSLTPGLRFLETVFLTAVFIFLLTITILSIIVTCVAWKGTPCLEKSRFLDVFSVAFLVTFPGIITAALTLLIVGAIIELILRISVCKLTPCCNFKMGPQLKEKVYEVTPLKAKDFGVPHMSCLICMEGFGEEESLLRLKCHPLHAFHRKCIEEWIVNERTCPACDEDVAFIQLDQSESKRFQLCLRLLQAMILLH